MRAETAKARWRQIAWFLDAAYVVTGWLSSARADYCPRQREDLLDPRLGRPCVELREGTQVRRSNSSV